MVTEQVGPAIHHIRWRPEELIRGVFISDEVRSRQPDAENITFYNFDERSFELAPQQLRFERVYSPPPPCPTAMSKPPRNHHLWEPASSDNGFGGWQLEQALAEWNYVTAPVVSGDSAGWDVWLAMRRAGVRTFHLRHEGQYFGANVVIRVPPGTGLSAMCGPNRATLDHERRLLEGRPSTCA